MPPRVAPQFKTPPVVEVICGIQFRPLSAFEAPHYGLFWESIRKDFPRSRTVSRLIQPVQLPQNEPAELTFQVGPEMPRVWFVSKDDTQLVQLQPDRFLFNWREGPNRATYPRFKSILKNFRNYFGKFGTFVRTNKLGELSLLNAEVGYINHIKPGEGWTTLDDIGEVFPDFAWRRGSRFLPAPETINFRSGHAMPGGHLSLSVQSARSRLDNTQIIRLDLTARGTITDLKNDSTLWKWYENANVWIVDAFIDITSKPMQRDTWKRAK